MGTPNFAVPALQALIDSKKIELVGVFCRPPKISGRGQKVNQSEIHKLAIANDIKVFTPNNFKDQECVSKFQELKADAALVVAYGIILPKIILESTKFGIINIHPSILPKYRGATPIQSTLLANDYEIGCSIIKMDEGVDSGDIIMQENFAINPDDDYSSLAPKLSKMGAEMALKSLFLLKDQSKFIKQDEKKASLSKKITKDDAKIDFSLPKEDVLGKIRALSGFLTSFFEYKGEKIKIFKARIVGCDEIDTKKYKNANYGDIFDDNFFIKCKNGAIQPLLLQKPGKKPVKIKDFLNSFRC